MKLLTPTSLPSPNNAGPRRKTTGIVIHNTAGGRPAGRELLSTINWFLNGQSQVSAHRLIGVNGEHVLFVSDDWIAWHARDANDEMLGLELEQGEMNGRYTDLQYLGAAQVIREWCQKYQIPVDRQHIRGHEEIPAGIWDGKQDPGSQFDWDYLMRLVTDPPVEVDDGARIHAPLTGEWREAYSNVLGIANYWIDLVRRFRAQTSELG